MGVGRPPKPSAVLRLQGSDKAAAREKSEPKVPIGEPERPEWVTGRAVEFWDEVMGHVRGVPGMLSTVDAIAAGTLAQALADYAHAREKVAEEGITVEGSMGSTVLNPSVRAMEMAWARVQKGLSQFGLSPVDRAKVAIGEGKSKDAGNAKGYFAAG